MYEASFSLKRRPFAATPDPTCFLSSGPIQAALDELVICVQQGQGVAVLTAPAGTGKTLLCERLCCELGEQYETVLLRHASFMTRRALLQTILCELNHTYHQPSEQELRLELFPAIRALQPNRQALVLICDEAHQLSDSLLEELRILADFAEAGRPLVRLVLVGQPALEEKLAQPGMEAINQRIRAQIYLSPFDRSESLDYLDYRLTWAGGRTGEVFTSAALEQIAQASDGIPRCINQLADHTLLLAFVAEQKPAGEDLVREALTDLRQLPLHWNEPISSGSHAVKTESINDRWTDSVEAASIETSNSHAGSREIAVPFAFESIAQNLTTHETDKVQTARQMSTIEFGADIEFPTSYSPADFTRQSNERDFTVGSDDWQKTVELFSPNSELGTLVQTQSAGKTKAAITEQSKSDLRHDPRDDFHSLLRDAYEAAGNRPATTSCNRNGDDEENPPADHPSPISNPIHQWPVDIEPISLARPSISQPAASTSEFEEEVVIDRYSAIDAGIEPPAITSLDTTSVDKVHPEPETYEIQAVPDHIELPLIVSDFAPVRIEQPTGESNATSNSMPQSTAVADIDSDIAEIAEEVYSLAESLRPSGTLSTPTDSILSALRREVDEIIETVVAESPPPSIIDEPHQQWESIETVPTSQPVPARPFRYLFSMLRRKQQGLS